MLNIFQQCTNTKKSYGLKIFMHNNIYINEEYLNFFKAYFENSNYFSVEFNNITKSFHLKTRKTNIKKDYNYDHTATFYNQFVIDMFMKFFNMYGSQIDKLLEYNAMGITVSNIISSPELLAALYSIVPVQGNVTIINL